MMTQPKKPMVADQQNLDLLMNVTLQITAELGKCKMSVADILKLGTGSIVELDRLAGGPVDLLVNNKLVARGEVVAIDENFGVRITELIQRPG
jgi:flagellar motor switch protein FliN/FliY